MGGNGGDSITAKDIAESGAFPACRGNGLRGYSDKFTHDGDYFCIGKQGALCGNITRVRGKAYFSEHAIVVSPNDENAIDFLSFRLELASLNRLSESSAQPGRRKLTPAITRAARHSP